MASVIDLSVALKELGLTTEADRVMSFGANIVRVISGIEEPEVAADGEPQGSQKPAGSKLQE